MKQPTKEQVLIFTPEYEEIKDKYLSGEVSEKEFDEKVWLDGNDWDGGYEIAITKGTKTISDHIDKELLETLYEKAVN